MVASRLFVANSPSDSGEGMAPKEAVGLTMQSRTMLQSRVSKWKHYSAAVTRKWLLVLLTCGACTAQTATKNPLAGDSQAAEAGRAAFRIFCSPWHGIRGEGGRGPDLTRGTFSNGDQDADLFRVIVQGVPGTEMPEFPARFEDDEVWKLVTYIRSIARRDTTPVTGDAASGAKLFWGKGGCGQCHRVGGKGGRLGPDLTRAGRQRSFAYLRESVLNPDYDLTPGYNTVIVVTRDGKKLVGVQKGFDNFTVQLMDAKENFYSFERSGVTSVKREYRSLMPGTYGRLFSETELNDLLAYLVSLRGEVEKR